MKYWSGMKMKNKEILEFYKQTSQFTAQSMIAELLRKNPNYDIKREAKDKIHIICRGQAILYYLHFAHQLD